MDDVAVAGAAKGGVQGGGDAPPVPCLCLVPAEAAGLVVGRGGSVVRQICRDSGADIDVSGEDDTPPSLSDRVVAIRGNAAGRIAALRCVVRITHRAQKVAEGEEGIFVLIVPTSATDSLIGPKGATITSLIDASGADVSISRSAIAGTQLQPVSICGTLEYTVAAAMRVDEILQQLADSGLLTGDPWHARLARGRGRPDLRGGAQPATRRPQAASAGSSRSPTSGRAGSASSRSATPARAAAGGSRGEAGSSSSRSLTPSTRSRTQPSEEAAPIHFVVSSSLAAWVVGRKGRSIADLRSRSGATVEVDRSGGVSRLVEIRGSHDARMVAVELLLEAMETLPEGAPGVARMLVPPGALDHLSSNLNEIYDKTGAKLDLAAFAAPGGSRVLVIGGERLAATRAAQLAAARLGEAPVDAPRQALANGNTVDGRGPAPQQTAACDFLQDFGLGFVAPARTGQAGALVPQAGDVPLGMTALAPLAPAPPLSGGLGAAAALLSQSPGEAALLKALLAGAAPTSARLQLALPLNFVQGILVGLGHLRAISLKFGSGVELGSQHSPPPTQHVTVTGTLLGNSLAVLYIQELAANTSSASTPISA